MAPFASLRVDAADDGQVVVAMVAAAAGALGLEPEPAGHLGLAAREVARAVRARGFDDAEPEELRVDVLRRGHRVVVDVVDRGLPFNYAAEEEVDGAALRRAVDAGWIDTVTHASGGREGNHTQLVRHLDAGVDLREVLDPAEHHAAVAAEPVSADLEVTERFAGPDDVEAICRLTWRTYGYTYQHDEYYQPDRLAAMLRSGEQVSFVAAGPDGEIVGHSAVLVERPDAVVCEGGRAMVDPRFRGHHLSKLASPLRNQWLDEKGMLAMIGAAVTAHTRSQPPGEDRPVLGLYLGFLPPIRFRGIEGTASTHREAVVPGFVPLASVPSQPVHLPRRDADLVQEIYRRVDLDRRVVDTSGAEGPPVGVATVLHATARADLGHAVVAVGAVGDDVTRAVRGYVRSVVDGGIEVVYVDLPLDDPATPWAAEQLAGEGFVFAGVVPLLAGGVDVIRYQRVGDLVIDPGEIHLRSNFARQVLDYVIDQLEARA